MPFADHVEDRPEASLETTTRTITIQLTADQAECLSGGYVPRSVKSILRELLDYELLDLTRAERPLPKARKR